MTLEENYLIVAQKPKIKIISAILLIGFLVFTFLMMSNDDESAK